MLLGEASFPLSQLLSAITEHFPFHATTADQTAFFRRALEHLGTSLGYRVLCLRSGLPLDDVSPVVTWWQPGIGTILAADSEWGNAGQIAAAFTNLMSIKSPMKLLVFQSRSAGADREDIALRTDIDAVLKDVGAAIIDFSQHIEGEIYVLVERVEQQSVFRSYTFRVPAAGKLALKFEEAAQVFRCLGACAAISGR